jgi:hypothetical protein
MAERGRTVRARGQHTQNNIPVIGTTQTEPTLTHPNYPSRTWGGGLWRLWDGGSHWTSNPHLRCATTLSQQIWRDHWLRRAHCAEPMIRQLTLVQELKLLGQGCGDRASEMEEEMVLGPPDVYVQFTYPPPPVLPPLPLGINHHSQCCHTSLSGPATLPTPGMTSQAPTARLDALHSAPTCIPHLCDVARSKTNKVTWPWCIIFNILGDSLSNAQSLVLHKAYQEELRFCVEHVGIGFHWYIIGCVQLDAL